MTVSTLTSSVTYTGNGSATSFAVPFKVLDADDLVVERLLASTGMVDHTYIGTDYSYSGVGDDAGTLTLSGTALSSTFKLKISRVVPYTQELDLINTGGFYPETVEAQLDRMVMQTQQVAAQSDDLAVRAFLVPEGETAGTVADLIDEVEAAAQAVIDAAVFTVTSANGQVVTSLALLAGIVAPVNGQVALLVEPGSAILNTPGRSGTWTFSTTDLSAKVTADPYHGLYMPPTGQTGSTGAWVRQPLGPVFMAAWWSVGATFGNNNQLPINSAFGLIPAGATLVLPPEQLTINAGFQLSKTGQRLFGAGQEATEVLLDPSASAATYPIVMQRSGCEVAYLKITHKPSNLNNGNSAAILASGNVSGLADGTIITDIKIHDIAVRNTSLAVAGFGLSHGNVGYWPTSRIDIWNVDAETNVMAFEITGIDEVNIHDCRIRYFESVLTHNSTNTLTPAIRVLGAHKVRISSIEGDGYEPAQGGHDALRFSAGNMDGTATGRRSNIDVIVERCRFKNFYGITTVDECRGDLIIRQCDFWQDPTLTTLIEGIRTNASGSALGMVQKVGRFIFEDNNVTGWSTLIEYDSNFGHVLFENNRWLGNSLVPDGTNYFIGYSQFGGVPLVEFLNNKCITMAGAYFKIATAGATEVVRVFGNTFGETAGNPNVQTALVGTGSVVGTSGAGTFLADQNRNYPTGTHAARIAWGDLA